MRPLGNITLDLEPLLLELAEDHDLQKGEILGLICSWIDVHYPGAIEEYNEGGNPIYYYGAPEGLKKLAEKL